MPSGITYDGVPSADGGDIFAGHSFWVALRVPMRNDILDKIKNNGGTIVPLEKNADILICDHARKDALHGSLSWTFIDDSVKHGIIQLQDRYVIAGRSDSARPVGGGGLTKGTRTAFTHADDVFLITWLHTHSDSREGNKTYQEMAAKNPRHTWQSWRNRFVKTLKFWPAEKLEALIGDAPEEEEEDHSREPAEEPQRQTPSKTSRQKDSPRKAPAHANQRLAESKAAVDAARAHETHQQPQRQTPHHPLPTRSSPSTRSPENMEALTEKDVMKARFHDDLSVYKEALSLDFPLRPRFGTRAIDVYDLVAAIDEQGSNGEGEEDVSFVDVAKGLGYNDDEASRVARSLENFYQKNLAPFISEMQELSESESEDNQDDDEDQFCTPDQGMTSVRPSRNNESPQSFVPSSPTTTLQRSKRTLDTSEVPSSERTTKRRRVSRSAEIPSTPPEKVGIMTQVQAGQTPHSAFEDVFEDATQGQLPELPPPEEEAEEDTTVVPATQVDGQEQRRSSNARFMSQQNSFDVTPSQQLHLESDDIPAGPSPVDRSRRERETSSSEESIHTPKNGQQSPGFVEVGSRTVAENNSGSANREQMTKAKPVKRRSLPSSFFAGSRKPLAPVGQPPVRDKQAESTKPGEASQSKQAKDNQEEILGWIEHYESLGFAHHTVIEGLKRTTMTPGGLAAHVMQSLQNKEGVPPNYEGVWTDRDDKGLLMVSTSDILRESTGTESVRKRRRAMREWDRLVDKHGLERIELRKMFLEVDGAEKAS